MAALLSCDGEATIAAAPLPFGSSTATTVHTMSENSNAGVGGGAQQDALLPLQTVQEDRVCDLGTGDLDHSGRGTGFTRPASFSVGEGLLHQHHQHHTSAAHTPNRIRAMSYDRDLHPRLVSNADEPMTTMLRSSMPAAAVATNNTCLGGGEIAGRSNESNESGFPPLFRRRTFTDAMEGNGSVRGGGRSPAGSVPVSVSEDNMLALLAKHLGGPIPTNCGYCGEEPASSRVDNTSEVPASRVDSGRFDVGAAGAWRNPPKGAAVARARRNAFVMR